MDNELTGAMISELYETSWHTLAVISVDAGGWHQIEPAADARAAGRRIVITQAELDFGSADFDRIAADLGGGRP